MSVIQSDFLNFKNIRHGFSLRYGGVSLKPWKSLNCSYFVNDNVEHVSINKRKILYNLGFISDFYVKQVHGNKIVNAEDYIQTKIIIEADGIICKTHNLPISITTADCAPILMVDPYNSIIGAAHAGWKGAISGVADNLINNFRINGSNLENIYAVIGPCISKESFEVKSDMINTSIKKDPISEKFFSNISNLDYFDLSAYLINKIKIAGVTNISCLGEDTYSNPERFFSHRYETNNKNAITGRMMNIIGLFK